MKIIVVTGGIGSGKSVAVRHLGSLGAHTLELDDLAKATLAPESRVLDDVARRFGQDIVLPDGSLDRPLLASRAFASPQDAAALNAIVHPAVLDSLRAAVEELRSSAEPPPALVIEVPLLSEAPQLADFADIVLALTASEELRVARALARNTLAEEDIRRRMRLQVSDEQRGRLAHVQIDNSGTIEDLLGELDRFWDEYVLPGDDR